MTERDDLGNEYYDLIDGGGGTATLERTNGHSQQSSNGAAVSTVDTNAPNEGSLPDPYTDVPPPEEPPDESALDRRVDVEIKADLGDLEKSIIYQVERINSTGENPTIYARGGKMVEIARADDPKDNGYRIHELSPAAFRSILSQHCRFYKIKKEGGEFVQASAKLPIDAISGLYDRVHKMNLAALKKFTQCPVYDQSGQLHSTTGYNAEIGAFIHFPDNTPPMPKVREKPTKEHAAKAAQWIKDELLHDFLFATDHGPAGVLGLMLTPMCVEMINGPRPLIAFDAPEAGSGKTLLAKVALWHVMPDLTLPTASESKAEFEKALTSQARKGRPIMAFDNLNIVADSGPFASAITGYPEWEARQLGVSEMLTFPAPDAWVITANGLELSDENARRTLIVRINKHHPRYSGWKHPNIRSWVHENRGRIQAALATMVNAWLAAGRPAPSSAALPSFEEWATVIGGILEHSGVMGLLENRSLLANPERQAWSHFGHVIMDLQDRGYLNGRDGATASQLIAAVNQAWQDDVLDERPELIPDMWTKHSELGRTLKKKRDSSLDEEAGLYLLASAGRANSTLYRVEKIEKTAE